ncbi:hypothetical protein KM043_005049 [Ampulex compressa]|nr:hypothetical protein KM043_005049 [Ampulex compressa]
MLRVEEREGGTSVGAPMETDRGRQRHCIGHKSCQRSMEKMKKIEKTRENSEKSRSTREISEERGIKSLLSGVRQSTRTHVVGLELSDIKSGGR